MESDSMDINELQKLYDDVEWKLGHYGNYVDDAHKGAYDDYLKTLNEVDSNISDLRSYQSMGVKSEYISAKMNKSKELLNRLQTEIDAGYKRIN
uniref:Uncharacterized protein n=1 Tax=Acrobeloides nanus TaxID=290746 RepID=A0A914EJZ5_9BILA